MAGLGLFPMQAPTAPTPDNPPASGSGQVQRSRFGQPQSQAFPFGNPAPATANKEPNKDQLSAIQKFLLQMKSSVDNLTLQVTKQNAQNQFSELKQQAQETRADIKDLVQQITRENANTTHANEKAIQKLSKQISRENAVLKQVFKDLLAKTATEIKKANDEKRRVFLEDWKTEATGWAAIILARGHVCKCEGNDKGRDVATQRLLRHVASTIGSIHGTLLHHVDVMEEVFGDLVHGEDGLKKVISAKLEALVEKHEVLRLRTVALGDRLRRMEGDAGGEGKASVGGEKKAVVGDERKASVEDIEDVDE